MIKKRLSIKNIRVLLKRKLKMENKMIIEFMFNPDAGRDYCTSDEIECAYDVDQNGVDDVYLLASSVVNYPDGKLLIKTDYIKVSEHPIFKHIEADIAHQAQEHFDTEGYKEWEADEPNRRADAGRQ